MRLRMPVVALAFCLCLTLACTSKPPADNNAASTDNNPPSSATPGGTAPANAPGQPGRAPSKAAEAPKPLVIPAGRTLTVRLGDTLSSKASTDGQPFSGTLVTPIDVEGETVLPAGSTVTGVVVTAHSAGRFKGASLLTIRLDSVTRAGKQIAIQTDAVSKSEKGKGKRTAAMIGGGAGVGALIGGLAGGGKGAAIGALAGGGAGTAGAGLTGNRDVTFPAESAVTFTLSTPVEIRR